MLQSKNRLNLFHGVCEIRYNPSLLFDDIHVLNNISKRMRDLGLQSSQRNQDGTLACVDPATRSLLVVGAQSSSFSMNEPKELPTFLSRASKYVPEVLAPLDVDIANRIGVRVQWMMPFDTIDEAAARLSDTAFSPSISSLFPNKINPGVQFSMPFGENVMINTGIRAETHQVLEIDSNIMKRNETTSGIVIDIDVFDQLSQTRPQQINGFVKNVDGKVDSVLKTVLSALG